MSRQQRLPRKVTGSLQMTLLQLIESLFKRLKGRLLLRRFAPVFLPLCFCQPMAAADSRPNIIIVMVDDMGFSDIGPYGSEIPTPNLDAMADGGVCFSQFYNTGRCCPTRASLLTGLYSHQTGIGWMTTDQGTPGYRGFLNDRCRTIAEVLSDAGYFTAMTGKWHVGHQAGVVPSQRGFDRSLNLPAGGLHFSNQTGSKGGTKLYLDGVEQDRDDPKFQPPWYGSELWTRWGLRFVDEAIEKDRPFFWYLAHVAPHFPCMAPEKTIENYRGKYKDGWDALRLARHQRQVQSGLIDESWSLTPRHESIPAWDSISSEEQTRYDDMMAIYAAMIEEVDTNMGMLMQELQQRGCLDNTLILFLSDNGGNAEAGIQGRYQGDHPGDPHSNVFIGKCWAHLNNTPFRKYKHYNHEGGIATPLIAHWPAGMDEHSPKDRRRAWIETPGHVIDLMPTCVELAGADYAGRGDGESIHAMEGTSLVPLLKGDRIADRMIFWEHEGNAAVREGVWKLVRAGIKGPWELYRMDRDRTEQTDLASQHPKHVNRLRTAWVSWSRRVEAMPKPPKKTKKIAKG